MPAAVIAGLGLALQAKSHIDQRKAAKQQQKSAQQQAGLQRQQFEVEKRKADIANVREKRDAIRRARVARALIVNTGANTGTSLSSGVQGGVSSVGAQLSDNLGYFGQTSAMNEQIIGLQSQQAGAVGDFRAAEGEAAYAGSLGALGATIFGAAKGYQTIFDARRNDG